MLGIMRKYKQSVVIKIVFLVIVASFIGTIFLVWGRGGEKGGDGSSYAVKVDGEKISYGEFQKSYNRLKGMFEQMNGRALSPEMEKMINLKKLAVDNLVESALVSREAGRMGIKVSKEDVRKAIEAVPAFQKNGVFDFQQYQDLLKMNHLTPAKFEEDEEHDLLIQKARQQIQDKAVVTDDEALQAFRKKNDRIDLSFVAFSPAELQKEVKLTDQDLNSYLQSHQDAYKTQEMIRIAFTILDPATIAAKQTLTAEEAQSFYQKNIDRYQGKGGILPYAEVSERVKSDARAFKGARQAYEMAADTINKYKSGDIAAAAASLGIKVTETPLFSAAAPASQLAGEQDVIKRAFALKQDELGGPVETKKGIYIIKVLEKKPAAVPPLERIKDQVEAAARDSKAKELAKQKAEQAAAELAKQNPALKLQETGSFGFSPSGDIPKIGKSTQMTDAAFSLTTAAPAAKTAFQIGNVWYAIKLKNRTELNKDAFPKEKDQIKQSLLPKKQQGALSDWIKGLKEKAKIEINPALLAD